MIGVKMSKAAIIEGLVMLGNSFSKVSMLKERIRQYILANFNRTSIREAFVGKWIPRSANA